MPGISIINKESYSKKYICPLCDMLMRDPIQTLNGLLSCKSCYDYAIEKLDVDICPLDGETLTNFKYFPDKSKKLEIMNLECVCMNVERGCEWNGTIRELDSHGSICIYMPMDCVYCDVSFVAENFDEHLIECCGLIDANICPFVNIGCRFKPTTEKSIKAHLDCSAGFHTMLQNLQIVALTKDNIKLENELKHTMMELETTKKDFDKLPAIIEQNDCSELSKIRSDTEINELKIGECGKNLSELDLKVQLMDNTTYDGCLIWKIDNFKQRLQQAIIGKVTALHSAPAFTEKYGYKFCARLYLNGDGMGRNTHMSLFFVVMQSEYDNLLVWPFNHRVTFTLINQEDQSKNIKETFIPDRHSSSFQKPKKQMNVAAGCPMFISKEELDRGNFIKDDCFFIRISA